MKIAFRTHPGNQREQNEDSVLADESLGLFIVADGMGGHRFGAQAGQMAVEHIRRHIIDNAPPPDAKDPEFTTDRAGRMLSDAFDAAHGAIIDFARRHAGGHIIGSTCTALWFRNRFAVAGHIGDSALFRLDGNRLVQLTTEHTLVQEMVEIGRLTPEEAKGSPYANVLNKVLGLEAKYGPEIREIDLAGDDAVFLICSDGLTKVVPVDELAAILDAGAGRLPDVESAAQRMLNLALERGGPDNISLILIHLPGPGPRPGNQ